MEIQLPNYIQQTYVADFLSSIDDKIKTEFEFHMLLISLETISFSQFIYINKLAKKYVFCL